MVDRVENRLLRLPPAWISRKVGGSGNIGNSEEIRKFIGEPIPRRADPRELDPNIAAMFGATGVLTRLAKKLGVLSKRKHKKLIPAHNTIACVDDGDNIYVGVEFLERHGENEALVAAILAHEWGHMISDLPRGVNWSHLTWEEVFELRREEEAYADGFAGRALYMLGYPPESMQQFLKILEKKRNPKLPTFKYHNTATRVAILQASYEAQASAFEAAGKMFNDPKSGFSIRTKKFLGQG